MPRVMSRSARMRSVTPFSSVAGIAPAGQHGAKQVARKLRSGRHGFRSLLVHRLPRQHPDGKPCAVVIGRFHDFKRLLMLRECARQNGRGCRAGRSGRRCARRLAQGRESRDAAPARSVSLSQSQGSPRASCAQRFTRRPPPASRTSAGASKSAHDTKIGRRPFRHFPPSRPRWYRQWMRQCSRSARRWLSAVV